MGFTIPLELLKYTLIVQNILTILDPYQMNYFRANGYYERIKDLSVHRSFLSLGLAEGEHYCDVYKDKRENNYWLHTLVELSAPIEVQTGRTKKYKGRTYTYNSILADRFFRIDDNLANSKTVEWTPIPESKFPEPPVIT